jgi:hypothetical protein
MSNPHVEAEVSLIPGTAMRDRVRKKSGGW